MAELIDAQVAEFGLEEMVAGSRAAAGQYGRVVDGGEGVDQAPTDESGSFAGIAAVDDRGIGGTRVLRTEGEALVAEMVTAAQIYRDG